MRAVSGGSPVVRGSKLDFLDTSGHSSFGVSSVSKAREPHYSQSDVDEPSTSLLGPHAFDQSKIPSSSNLNQRLTHGVLC